MQTPMKRPLAASKNGPVLPERRGLVPAGFLLGQFGDALPADVAEGRELEGGMLAVLEAESHFFGAAVHVGRPQGAAAAVLPEFRQGLNQVFRFDFFAAKLGKGGFDFLEAIDILHGEVADDPELFLDRRIEGGDDGERTKRRLARHGVLNRLGILVQIGTVDEHDHRVVLERIDRRQTGGV